MAPLTLAIETSNPSALGPTAAQGTHAAAGSVCVGRGSSGAEPEILAWTGLSPASRHDDALMPAIAEVCARAGAAPADLARVAVSVGPGGFTSLRIAVTTAKMICEATGAACVAVPTAHALALSARAEGVRGTVGVLLAWKRDDVWRQRFEASDHSVQATDAEGRVVPLEHAHDGCATLVAEPTLRAMLAPPTHVVVVTPRFDARSVLAASLRMPETDPAQLVPIYPREPEAVTKWRTLGKAKTNP